MFRPGLRAFQNSFRPTKPHVQFRAYQQRRFGDPRQQYRRFNAAGLFMRWAARPTFYRDVGLISLGAGGFYYFNLEEVPVSAYLRRTPSRLCSDADSFMRRYPAAAASTS
jgi:uncharacterized protein (DUF2461 family)